MCVPYAGRWVKCCGEKKRKCSPASATKGTGEFSTGWNSGGFVLTFPSGRKGAFVVDPHEGQDPLSTVCQIKGMMTFNTENNFTGHLLGRLGGLTR